MERRCAGVVHYCPNSCTTQSLNDGRRRSNTYHSNRKYLHTHRPHHITSSGVRRCTYYKRRQCHTLRQRRALIPLARCLLYYKYQQRLHNSTPVIRHSDIRKRLHLIRTRTASGKILRIIRTPISKYLQLLRLCERVRSICILQNNARAGMPTRQLLKR